MRREKGRNLRGWAFGKVGLALVVFLFALPLMAQDEPEPAPDAEAGPAEEPAPEEGAEATPGEEAPAEEPPAEEPPVEEPPAAEPPAEEPPVEETEPPAETPEEEESEVLDETGEGETPEFEEPDEEITITGTRIGRSNLEDYAQITVLTSDDIEISGVTDIDQLLRYMPTVSLSSTKSTSPTAGGSSSVSLRNLGSARTLKLLNGRRMTVTLSDIPVAMIERVEILLDGASAIYGSDAVSGVVNIILKDDFEGLDVATNAGISDKWDGEKFGASATMGMTGDDGNVTTNITYQHRGAVRVRDRSWAHPPCDSVNWALDGSTQSICGSPTTPGGHLTNFNSIDPMSNIEAPDGWVFQGGDGHFHPMQQTYETWLEGDRETPYDMYNWGEEMVLTSRVDKVQVITNGHYDFNEFVTGYIETIYSHIRGLGRYAGLPITQDHNQYFPDTLNIHYSNPFIPQSFWDDVISFYGINYDSPHYLTMDKRTSDVGARVFDAVNNEFNSIIGLKGEIAPGYNWDIYLNVGKTSSWSVTRNSIDARRYQVAINPEACYADPQCILADMFGEGVMQGDVREYLGFDDTGTWEWSMINGGAQFVLEPFSLPGGKFAAVIGGDIRYEKAASHPDSKKQDHENASMDSNPTDGSFNAQEAFIEFSAPFISDLPGAYILTLDLAGRASHFNFFGTEFTYRAGLSYGPLQDIRFRGIASTSYRAPSIFDLFGGGGSSYPTVVDPCSAYENPATEATQYTIDQCNAAGLSEADLGGPFTQLGSQVRTVSHSNPNLGPETSQTINVGTVITPTFMPKQLPLSMTFDYYNIWIYDAITSLNAADILRNCYTIEGYNEYCDLITRNPDTGQVSNIDTSIRNINELKTAGFDFTFNLGFPIFQSIRGKLSFQGNILLTINESDPDAEAAGETGTTQYFTGTIAPAGGGDPDFRFISGISLGNQTWTLDNRVRYVHGMDIQDAADGAPYTTVPAVAYWDMAAALSVGDFNISIGLDNVLDKIPPYLPGSHYNGNIAIYDTIGRYIWTRLNYHFH